MFIMSYYSIIIPTIIILSLSRVELNFNYSLLSFTCKKAIKIFTTNSASDIVKIEKAIMHSQTKKKMCFQSSFIIISTDR